MEEDGDEAAAGPEGPTDASIEVVQAGRGRWRIVDRARAIDDERRLLGCIEQRDERFDVRQIGAQATSARFTSWDDAVDRIVQTGAALAEERARLGIRWRM